MPTKTWEPPPFQADTDTHPPRGSAEPRNFEPSGPDRDPDPDASVSPRGAEQIDDYEEINTHGSER
jgi:hypothetical protein